MHNNPAMNLSQQQQNNETRHPLDGSAGGELTDRNLSGSQDNMLCTGSCDTLCSQQNAQQQQSQNGKYFFFVIK